MGKRMNRKEFLKGMAAVVGGLAVPGTVRAADFRAAIQDASGADDAAFWKLVRASSCSIPAGRI